jgi:hypothetical protein
MMSGDDSRRRSILNVFHALSRSVFFSSSSRKSTTRLMIDAVASSSQSSVFQTVEMRSRAADWDAV